MISVSTRGYDVARTGVNSQETVLTAAAVAQRGIKRLYSLHIPNDARGAEAQPLTVSCAGRDIVIIATLSNNLRAFETDTGEPVWSASLGPPINKNPMIDAWNIQDHWGVLSTPVISNDVVYSCAWSSPDGSVAKARHYLHANSVATGLALRPPLDLEGAVYDPGGGVPVQRFASATRKQRASLLALTGGSFGQLGTVFIAFGSVFESAGSSRGWIIAVDIMQWRTTGAWCTAVHGSGGGIWQGGSGPAADAAGDIYVMTGNGDFDAHTEWGESFVKLRYAPPRGTLLGKIEVVDWWSPFLDSQRLGPRGLAFSPELPPVWRGSDRGPTNYRKYALDARLAALRGAGLNVPLNGGEAADMDLGSGGPVVIEELRLVLGAGKDGILYVLKKDNMGKTLPAELQNLTKNYNRLAAPPVWFTHYADASPAPATIGSLNYLFGGVTHHQHSSPIVWKRPDGYRLINWGENDTLRAWNLYIDGTVAFLAAGSEIASPQAPRPPGGMPGGMLTLGWDGSKGPSTGVVWACVPYGDANREVSPGRLLGYAADDYAAGKIGKIWDSEQWNIQFSHCKFTPPVVANGRLYVPTYEGRIDAYGLG